MDKYKAVKVRDMNPDVWRAIKIEALQQNVTMAEMIKMMADKYFGKEIDTMESKKVRWVVMMKSPETVGGWTFHKYSNTPEPKKIPKGASVWTESEYEEWHNNQIMPFYH